MTLRELFEELRQFDLDCEIVLYDADDWDEETPYQLDEFGFKRSNDGSSVVLKFIQQ